MTDNKSVGKLKMDFSVDMNLTEKEIKALDALAGYGTKEFLNCFYNHMGKAYLEPHESGIVTLFKKIKSLMPVISQVNEVKKKALEVALKYSS